MTRREGRRSSGILWDLLSLTCLVLGIPLLSYLSVGCSGLTSGVMSWDLGTGREKASSLGHGSQRERASKEAMGTDPGWGKSPWPPWDARMLIYSLLILDSSPG